MIVEEHLPWAVLAEPYLVLLVGPEMPQLDSTEGPLEVWYECVKGVILFFIKIFMIFFFRFLIYVVSMKTRVFSSFTAHKWEGIVSVSQCQDVTPLGQSQCENS